MKTSKFQFETVLIMIFGVLALFAPVIMKTKSLSCLIAPHAILIVVGGTLCAGCLAFSVSKVFLAFSSLKSLIFKRDKTELINLADEIIDIAKFSRAKGILALSGVIDVIENPFLKKAVRIMLEEDDTSALEENLRFLSFYENKTDFQNVEIFEELGGYAPTFGMLGAVIGLIQISALNSEPKALLSGIATAFIATVYGVGSANMIFLPLAKKLKNNLDDKLLEQEIIMSAIIDIANMQSSVIVSEKLDRILMENNVSRGAKIFEFAA